MKILVTGATGFIGTPLVENLIAQGHEVVVLSRHPQAAIKHFAGKVKAVAIDQDKGIITAPDFAQVEVIINLMGENISSGRWSDERKRKIRNSRVNGTKAIIDSVQEFKDHPLKVLINASAVGIYPANTGAVLTESSPAGSGFLADVCREWENEAQKIKSVKPQTRLCITRFGVVLAAGGGALQKMLPPFKMGVGGRIGDGKQMMSWIHRDDLVALLSKAVTDSNYEGIFNATAPRPVSNEEFTKALGGVLHRPTVFPVPEFALKLAFGEMSSVILDSQDVRPKHLEDVGFKFKFSDVSSALAASV